MATEKQIEKNARVDVQDLETPARELSAEEQAQVQGGLYNNETCKETKDSGMSGCGLG